MELITAPHLDAPGDFYEALVETPSNLETAESQALDARLVLVLANHIGPLDVLRQAMQVARGGVQ